MINEPHLPDLDRVLLRTLFPNGTTQGINCYNVTCYRMTTSQLENLVYILSSSGKRSTFPPSTLKVTGPSQRLRPVCILRVCVCVCVRACVRACVRMCVCVCVGRGESAIIQLRIYVRSALTYASFHVTITVITMAASSTSTMPAMTPPTFVPESGEEGLVITFFTPLICVLMLQRSCNGLIQWGWIAKVCSLHNIFCLSTIRFT